MSHWWASVPEWAKPVILGAVIATAVGLLAWIFKSAVPFMTRVVYTRVLERVENTEGRLRTEMVGRAAALWIDVRLIESESGVPRWLIRRAKRWEDRRKKGRLL